MNRKPDQTQITAWRRFLTAHATLIGRIENDLAGQGLPPLSWYDALFALHEARGNRLRMHELADAVLLTRSNLTRLVDRLESAGLLSRAPCLTDRRGSFAVLTGKGLEMLRRMWPVYARGIHEHFARRLSEEETRHLSATFDRLIREARTDPSTETIPGSQ